MFQEREDRLCECNLIVNEIEIGEEGKHTRQTQTVRFWNVDIFQVQLLNDCIILKKIFLILTGGYFFRESRREGGKEGGERETETLMSERYMDWLPPTRSPVGSGDRTCSLGTCP